MVQLSGYVTHVPVLPSLRAPGGALPQPVTTEKAD